MRELIINKRKYSSRLILGTGKYKDFEETKSAIEASGCEMVTVAIRRMNLGQDKTSKNLLDYVSPKKGGFGCVRDVLEQVLKIQDNWDLKSYDQNI